MDYTKLKIVIVEDMAVTRASLEDNLEDNNFIVAGSFAKAETAWEALKNNENVDLILLDIHLAGDRNGIWLAKKIREHNNIPIVFLTAYGDEGTLKEVVSTHPNGYLMKPYNTPTLLTTIQIAIQKFNQDTNKLLDEELLYIKDSNLRVKLVIDEIIYIQSEGNYLHIQLKNKKHLIRSKMADFSKDLPSSTFVRVHQRFIVNIKKIEEVGSDHIALDGMDIRLSGKYKMDLFKLLNLH